MKMPPSGLADGGCFHATRMPPIIKSPVPGPRFKFKAQPETDLATQYADRVTGRQAGTHFLLLLSSSGHTFFVTLRFFLQEIVTKDEDQKKDHMPWAADLCFLYLHVSQKTALYRNTDKRPQQTSSRTETLSVD